MKHGLFLILIAGLLALPLGAQDEPAANPQLDKIATTRAQVTTELEAGRQAVQAASEGDAKPPQTLQRTVELLEQTDAALAQLAAIIAQGQELQRAKADLIAKHELLSSGQLDEQPPFTFALLDSLRDELSAENAKLETSEASLKAVQANLEQARNGKEDANQARLQAKALLDANKDPQKQAQLGSAHRLAALSSRLAGHVFEQRKLEADNEKISQEIDELRRAFLTEKIAVVAANAQFTEQDKQKQLLDIATKKSTLESAMASAKMDLDYNKGNFIDAKKRLDQAGKSDPAMEEQVKAWRAAVSWRQAEMELISGQTGRLAELETIWTRRFELARRSPDRAILNEWLDETEKIVTALGHDELLAGKKLADLRKQLVTIEGKRDAAQTTQSGAIHWLHQRRQHVLEHIKVYERELTSIEEQRRVADKLIEDITVRLGGFTLQGFASDTWKGVRKLWNYSIEFGDKENPVSVSVGRFIAGMILIVFGFFLSRLISRMIGGFLRRRANLNRDASMALQSVIFYLMLMVLTLIALNMVNVPLTVFTLLGGGIAIGVGFGAQNIINNFISGWILIAERPVRIGDLIEIEGVTGHVRSVGARCTRIRRSDGIDLLVPNSLMLERNLINWTLSDTHIRTTVRVGVIYGSPTDQAARLIQRVVTRCPRVLAHPKPILIFEDFGDNALIFDIFFWVHATAEMDLRHAESEIRFEIDQVFRAAGIVIAFPQRDTHLYPKEPIEVRMIDSAQDDGPAPQFSQQRERVALLREIDLFHSLTEDEIDALGRHLIEHEFDAEEDIVVQDDPGSALFILVGGLLEVKMHADGRERVVGQLIPGEFFGEMAMLTGEPRVATVTAVTNSRVFELRHESLKPILQERQEVAELLSRALAQRRKQSLRNAPEVDPYPDVPEAGFVGEMRRRINRFFGLE